MNSCGHKGSRNKLGWEVILFFAVYLFMPSYCAIELSSSLPLITASRLLWSLMAIMLVCYRRNDLFDLRKVNIRAWNLGLTADVSLKRGLMTYFALLLTCNAALLPTDKGEALKALFVLIAESYLLVWMLTLILNTREKLVKAIKVLVMASGVVAVIAAIGCVLGINPFHYLNTVQRKMLMTSELRLGMLRAEAGFGHPVYYGAFCAVIAPINMYLIEYSEKRWEKRVFSLCLSMNVVGLVLSNSRGSLAAFGCILIVFVALRIRRKEFWKMIRIYMPSVLIALAVLVLVASSSAAGIQFLQGIINSLLNVLFPGQFATDVTIIPEANPAAPVDESIVINYGSNTGGMKSRIAQLSGIVWTLSQKPLFGLGSNAHVRGLIAYQYVGDQWWVSHTFDMGLVAIVCQYGLIGLLGYAALYAVIFKTVLAKRYREDPLMRCLGLAFVSYMLCLITIASLDRVEWILIALIVCLTNICRKKER